MSALTRPAPVEAVAMGPGLVVLVLALLIGIQPIATDVYLPALPGLATDLGASPAQAQLTLSAMVLAFGISQLVWGPISDRFGRRPVLLAGLATFTLATIGCLLAPSINSLTVWRAIQGAAMGASVVGGRAIVRDLYTVQTGISVMSRAQTGLGLIACLSAPLGGLMAEYLSWRWTLTVPAVFGLAALLLVALRMKESLPAGPREALRPAQMARTWAAIARHPTFLAWTALSVASYGGLFTFLAASPFVLIDVLGQSRLQFGVWIFSLSIVYIGGTFLCRRMLLRLGVRRTVAIGALLSLAGGTLLGVLALAGVHTVWALVPPYCLYMIGHGIHQPCGQSGAMGPFPKTAGTAAALNGFFTMLVAFAIGGWIGTRMDGTVFALTNGVWFWSASIALAAWTLVQRYGEPRAT